MSRLSKDTWLRNRKSAFYQDMPIKEINYKHMAANKILTRVRGGYNRRIITTSVKNNK